MAEPRIAVLVSLGRHPVSGPGAATTAPRWRWPGAWAARPSPCCTPAIRTNRHCAAIWRWRALRPDHRRAARPGHAGSACRPAERLRPGALRQPRRVRHGQRPAALSAGAASGPSAIAQRALRPAGRRRGPGAAVSAGPAPRHGSGPAGAADRAPRRALRTTLCLCAGAPGAYCPLRRPPRSRRWQTPGASNRPTRGRASWPRPNDAPGDRLLAATAMTSRGGEVIQHGTPEDKARAVLAYLRTHNLVDY